MATTTTMSVDRNSLSGDSDPFRFDELQKRLSLIEKSMDAPKAAEFETLGIKPEHMLEHLCGTMCSYGLAKHLEPLVSVSMNGRTAPVAELRDRERVRAALKLAPSPADLVYLCSSYVENGDAYVLLMELFLQMICDGEVEIAESTKQAAHARARRWRKLYRACGGSYDDQRVEARAFLFFLCSFGIPDSDSDSESDSDFGSDYIMNLIILSHPSEIPAILRQSRVLVPMIPGLIEKMIQQKLYGEAIDLAFTFGIEDKFPPQPIMDSFIAEYGIISNGWSRSGSVKELEKAHSDLVTRFRTVVEALADRRILVCRSLSIAVKGLLGSIREALRDLKSNGDSAADGKRKRDEMDMETEHPPLARRLTMYHSVMKRPRKEPIICHLILLPKHFARLQVV